MKILVTGAGGQLGRALLERSPPDTHCIGLTRTDLDLTDSAAVRTLVEHYAPNVVINAAAYTAVDRSEQEPKIAFAVNSAGVRALRLAAEAVGAHFVHISTDFVFDGQTSRAYRPGDTRNPVSVYGLSKAEGEDASGAAATIVRTSWVYGRDGSNFVKTMLQLMRERDEVRVVADQIGTPTWARGLAAVVWQLAFQRLAGIWHHADGGVASWYDFAVAIAEEGYVRGLLTSPASIFPCSSAEYPTPAHRPAFSVLDTTRTRTVLNDCGVHWRVNLRAMLDELANDLVPQN